MKNESIWAARELLKRYLILNSWNIAEYEKDGIKKYYNKSLVWDKDKQEEMIQECINVCSSTKTDYASKKAARLLLDIMVGKERANDYLDEVAIVVDRDDPLVRRWRKKVLENSEYRCVSCGSKKKLEAHHISEWSDDPINRINPNNGIALCVECHAKEHPELSNLILSRVKQASV